MYIVHCTVSEILFSSSRCIHLLDLHFQHTQLSITGVLNISSYISLSYLWSSTLCYILKVYYTLSHSDTLYRVLRCTEHPIQWLLDQTLYRWSLAFCYILYHIPIYFIGISALYTRYIEQYRTMWYIIPDCDVLSILYKWYFRDIK